MGEIIFYNGRVYMLEDYYSRKELLEKLKISPSTLYRRCKEGFPKTQMGRLVFHNKKDVNLWLENHSHMELSHPSYTTSHIE